MAWCSFYDSTVPRLRFYPFSDAGVSFQHLSCVSLCEKNKRKGGVEKEGKGVKEKRSQGTCRKKTFP